MLSKSQIVKFHGLINLIDTAQDSPFLEMFLDEEWVQKEINKIFKEKENEKGE